MPRFLQRTTWLPYAVLTVGLVATALAGWGFRTTTEDRDRTRFENAATAIEDRIQDRMDAYAAVLRATRGMFLASSLEVDVTRFRRFVAQLGLQQHYPGIQGIGFSRRITRADLGAVETELQTQGHEGFHVWPAGDRDEQHAVVFLEPLERRNRAALGYDMSTEPTRKEAMDRARDTGAPAMTGVVTLVQEIDAQKQAGFLIYLPLYRGGVVPRTLEERRTQLVGFVYSPFRAGDLLAGIFGSEREPRVTFSVSDITDGTARLLHRAPAMEAAARFEHVLDLPFAGRIWQVEVHSTAALDHGSSSWLFPYVLAAGVLVTLLLFTISRLQVRSQDQLRLHAEILDSMTEGVSLATEGGTIVYTNPAEDDMFGYARGELIGRPITVQTANPPDEHAGIMREVVARMRERGAWQGEFENVKQDGTRFVTAARISALPIGGRTHWVCVQRDITDRKRIEREGAALLEREQALRAAAEAASRTKDEFLAMLGHELRNPLAPIVTALQLIRRRSAVPDREYAIIERQVRHLRRLVDDLLDVSAITRGKVVLDRRRLELAAPVAMACEVVTPLLEARHHALRVEVAPSGLAVDGDEARLAQIISNLLSNAAKYTDPGGHLVLRAALEDGEIVLRVRDDGIGIAPDAAARVFELFVQGERRIHRASGGLGLGLAIVKSLVELHGGKVEAHSDGVGRGSEFVVRLPPATDDAAEARTTTAPTPVVPAAARPLRVLVVDDNTDAADLLADLLRTVGHEVEVAYDPAQALEVVERAHSDVAILDIGLPVMDGYELGARLREKTDVTLIALTGFGQEHDRAKSAAAGFAHHLVKPVPPLDLIQVLDRVAA